MTLIANKITEEPLFAPTVTERFELFTPVEMETVDGTPVTVKKSIGFYRIEDLQQQKTELLNRIAEIDEKIAAIQSKG